MCDLWYVPFPHVLEWSWSNFGGGRDAREESRVELVLTFVSLCGFWDSTGKMVLDVKGLGYKMSSK